MRKTKILACFMSLAMLMSALLIPANATVNAGDGDGAYSGDPTVLVLDETMELGSGYQQSSWGTPTIDGSAADGEYQSYTRTVSNLENCSGKATKFDIWYANNGTHLYFYLSATLPSGHTYDNNDIARFYLDFYNQHDKVYTTLTRNGNPYQTYLEDGRSYADTETLRSGQFEYNINTEAVSDATYMGTKGTDYVITKSSNTAYTIEGRILLPKYIQDAIAAGNRPVIGLGHEVRQKINNVEQYVMGYFDASAYDSASVNEYGFIYDDYSMCPDLVLAAESNCEPLLKTDETCSIANEVTLDGAMGDTEGWATLPYMILDSFDDGAVNTVAYRPAEVYVSTDRENLYLFVDAPYAIYRTYFFIQLDEAINKGTSASVDGTDWLLYGGLRGTENNGQGSTLQKNKNANYATDGSNAFGQTTWQYNAEKTAVEIKIPLPDNSTVNETTGKANDIKTQLTKQDVDLEISVFVRQSNSTNDGYTTQRVSAPYGSNWNEGEVKVTLPKLPSTTEIQVEGLQHRVEVDATTGVQSTDVRFVASMKGEYTDYESIGFSFVYDGKTATPSCQYVYTGLMAAGEMIYPDRYEANYFFCYTIEDLAAGEYTFDVRCWSVKKGSETAIYSDMVTVNLTVNEDGTVTINNG